MVSRDTWPLLQNALTLIGIPFVGIIGGAAILYYLPQGFTHLSGSGIAGGTGMLAASMDHSVLLYRRLNRSNVPEVVRVLKKGHPFGAHPENPDAKPCTSCHISW